MSCYDTIARSDEHVWQFSVTFRQLQSVLLSHQRQLIRMFTRYVICHSLYEWQYIRVMVRLHFFPFKYLSHMGTAM